MTWQEALVNIESLEFAADANIASNVPTFIRIIGDTEAVRTLEADTELANKTNDLASRAYALCQLSTDIRYRHRWDVALATYIWLLGFHNPEYANILSPIVKRLPQCWWALRLAVQIPPEFPTLGYSADSSQSATYPPGLEYRSVILANTAQDSLLFPIGSALQVGDRRLQFMNYGLYSRRVEDPAPNRLSEDNWTITFKTDSLIPELVEVY